MILIWLVVGVLLTSFVFFLAPASTELWPSLNAAGLVIAVYLLAVVAYTMRKPFSAKARLIAWAGVVVIGGAIVSNWMGMDSTSHWQRKTILNISGIIHRGIIMASIPDSLNIVLKKYHDQGRIKKATLGQVFRQQHPGAAVGENIYHSEMEWDSLRVYVSALSDSEVTLVAQEMYVKGRDPTFRNFNGRAGMVQEQFTLSEKGFRYESQN